MKVLSAIIVFALAISGTATQASAETRKVLLKSGGWVAYSVKDYNVDYDGGTYGAKSACAIEFAHSTATLRMTMLPDGMAITEIMSPNWSFRNREDVVGLKFETLRFAMGNTEYKGDTIRQVSKPKEGLQTFLAMNKELNAKSAKPIAVLDYRKKVIANFPYSGFKRSLERMIKCQKSL